jgi:hypothetical protein
MTTQYTKCANSIAWDAFAVIRRRRLWTHLSLAFFAVPVALGGDLPIEFRKHVIDGAFETGYQVSVADVDMDGLPDVVALSTSPSRLVWYRNPDWTRYSISTTSDRNIDVAPHDIDGDGDVDLALASEFSLGDSLRGGLVQWLECPPDPTQTQEWTARDIDRVPTAHRVRWADVTGDGRKELVNLPIVGIGAKSPKYDVAVQFKAYRVPEDPTTNEWPRVLLDNALHMAHGIAVVDWDGSTPEELLTASFEGVVLYQHVTNPQHRRKVHIGSGNRGQRPAQGSSEVSMGTFAAEGSRFIAAIEPWHGHEVVVYTPDARDGRLWLRTVIDNSFNDGHALGCADFDGDGADDIVAGHRGPNHSLYVYRSADNGNRWDRIAVDEGGMAAAGVYLADLNLDGAVDIVAIGTATNNVVWYENLSPTRDTVHPASQKE